MLSFITKRIAQLLIIMFGVSFITFSITTFLPSDPVTMQYQSMGIQGDKATIEAQKEALGLNDSFIVQYTRWIGRVLHGDFGQSIRFNIPVSEKLMIHIPNTLKLTAMSILMTLLMALPLGILSALYQNRFTDYLIRFVSFLGVSIPSFWLGLLLIYYFSVKWRVLPTMGMASFKHILLPAFALSSWFAAIYTRRIRTSILEEMNKDYVIGLLAKGISRWRILMHHVLPNSLLPIVTAFGMSIGSMMGGTIVIETIFEWQGVGRVAMDAISNRDYPLIQGYVLWMAFIFVGINLVVDISYHLLNPKIRLGKQ